jgi:peptidoglycan/xylan/chitin deacetylase (PgdA/CDA1 family)/uncharacterized lipoprotein YddW (UPF0748 family)
LLLALFVSALGAAVPARARAEEPEPAPGCRVFLTFDVEREDDIEALRRLDPPGPCTLFLTGEFAEAYPDVVRQWAKRHEIGCHTMTHPHLSRLDAAGQAAEIGQAAAILERLSGAKCLGFRAPYLEANEETRKALVRLGFRYQSSVWDEIDEDVRSTGDLLELPITPGAGDYNLFDVARKSDDEALRFLLASYAERTLSGRPMVILLHPHMIARHAGVLQRFIEHVGRDPSRWGCFRDWLNETGARRAERRALWVDVAATSYEPEEIVESARRLGITDLIVQAYDPADGPLFGPDRPQDGWINGIIDVAHDHNLRVHAWFSLCFDPARLNSHPEWGMVSAVGAQSKEFVCPTNARWRHEVVAMLRQLIENYAVDGIHLEELRFPAAEFCQCPACRAALARRAGEEWPLGRAPSERSAAQFVWWDYRTDLIRDLTESLAREVRELDDRLTVSAALSAEGAMNFDGARLLGQSYEKLCPLLDFVIPMAYHQRDQQPVAWVQAVQRAAHWRAGATPVWIGVQAFQEPGRPALSLDEFARTLESVRRGSAGVAFSSFASLFSLAEAGTSPTNMPPGAADLVRRFGMGLRLGPATHGPTPQPRPHPEMKPEDVTWQVQEQSEAMPRSRGAGAPKTPTQSQPPAPLIRGSGKGALAGSGFVAVIVTVLLVLRLRPWHRHRPATDLPEFPLSALEALAVEPVIRGDQAILITQRLQTLEPAEIDRIHRDVFLLRIHHAGGIVPVATADETQTAPVMARAETEAECAVRAGFVRDAGGCWQLTPAGADRLRAILANRSDRTWEQFVENRLDESLLVTCPNCGSSQHGHWLRPTLGCPQCHRRFALRASPTVMPRNRFA